MFAVENRPGGPPPLVKAETGRNVIGGYLQLPLHYRLNCIREGSLWWWLVQKPVSLLGFRDLELHVDTKRGA